MCKATPQSMKRPSIEWCDGQWVRRPGGSGRELVWFPEPIAGADCYRAALPDPILLHQYSHQLQELLLEYLHHDKIGLRLGYLC